MTAIRIAGGKVHDPANGVDGEVRDVCLDDRKVVADVGPDARRIDARGMVVMPGGVDIHAHIAGPKLTAARKLSPEDRRDDPLDRTDVLRSGTGGLVPSTFATGYRYSLLGYTTVVEAAAPPLAARHVLSELRDTPMIDKAFLLLMGNNQVLFELIRESGGGVSAALKDAVAWWLEATGGYGVKLVNPGGVELCKQSGGDIDSLDDEVAGFGVTPRQVLQAIGGAVDELGLPHPVHIHANNLGVPGNADTTLETMRTLSGRQAHFAHVQFHSYGGKPGGLPQSRAPGPARAPEHPSRAHRRRRPGDVRAGDDNDRRRARLGGAPRPRRRQVVQPRHRGRDRLRDRAVHLPGRQLRPRPPVGDRARAVPARPGSLAGDAVDRPSQRRLVPVLPEADPPADGSRVPRGPDRPRQPARRSGAPRCSMASSASTR